jgi:hypothetical protein
MGEEYKFSENLAVLLVCELTDNQEKVKKNKIK